MVTTDEMPGVAEEQSLAHRILTIIPLLMRFMHRRLRDSDARIEPNQFQILVALAERQRSVSELAVRQRVSLPSMSKTVNMLVERGWVERTSVAGDRRVVQLRLTDAGRRSLQAAYAAMLDAVDQVVSRLTPDEQDRLSAGLDILYSAFGSVTGACDEHDRARLSGAARATGQVTSEH